MSQNVKFNYLYRDAGNYKLWGDVVFGNPENLALAEIEKRLARAFNQETIFVTNQINIPTLSFGEITDDDHCYHEYYSCELCAEVITDELNRTIGHFLNQIESVALHGWRAFDPMDQEISTVMQSLKPKPI